MFAIVKSQYGTISQIWVAETREKAVDLALLIAEKRNYDLSLVRSDLKAWNFFQKNGNRLSIIKVSSE